MMTEVKRKRATIEDFFAPKAKRLLLEGSNEPKKVDPPSRHPPTPAASSPTTKPLPTEPYDVAQVPGLTIHPSFISPTEDRATVTFLDTLPWRNDLQRRTMHFGGTYCYEHHVGEGGKKAPGMPEELGWIVERMVGSGIFEEGDPPTNCIVNEYIGNQGINAHVDKLTCGPTIASLSLNHGCYFKFYELKSPHDGTVCSGKNKDAPRTGKEVELWVPKGSLLVMRGDARSLWQHEVPRTMKGRTKFSRRVSLTYRAVEMKVRICKET